MEKCVPESLGPYPLFESPILCAFYGSWDVTEKVRSMYDKGEREFYANNVFWGDPNPGIVKVLVVIFRDYEKITHLIADESASSFSGKLTLPNLQTFTPEKQVEGSIIYAVYGSEDVTNKTKKLYSEGAEVFEASNNVWGDPNPGLPKWLYIFFSEGGCRINGKPAFEYGHKSKSDKPITPAGHIILKQSPILSAYYGTQDVTEKIKAEYKSGVRTFHANNSFWGDPNPGIPKVLVVIYQEGKSAVAKVSDESNKFFDNFLVIPDLPTDLQDLENSFIISAVYGSRDITKDVINRYMSIRLMEASNSLWGDPNVGYPKWLYVFYLWGGKITSLAAYEHGSESPPKMFWIP